MPLFVKLAVTAALIGACSAWRRRPTRAKFLAVVTLMAALGVIALTGCQSAATTSPPPPAPACAPAGVTSNTPPEPIEDGTYRDGADSPC